MKNVKRIAFLFIIGLCAFIPMINTNAKEPIVVTDKAGLLDAVNNAQTGDVIQLGDNITLDSVADIIIVSGKEITIDGANHTITGWRDDEVESPSGNQSIITALETGANIHIKNLKLENSQKYGIQAYDGGYVDLENVTIDNCRYGAILVNAGSVEVISLALGANGETENNGIEISKAKALEASANEPTVIMNGTITSEVEENVIRFAKDENDVTKSFTITNEDTTTDKILVEDNKVVITNENNEVKFVSNESKEETTLTGEEYVPTETEEETDPTTPPESTPDTQLKEETNPETSDPLLFIVIALVATTVIGGVTVKTLKNRA